MKVIDLLNKTANKEEVPKKIKVLFNVFEYDEDNYNYKNVDKTRDNLLRHLGSYKGIALNDDVEIIEDVPKEDKKIEKLNEHYYHDEPALIDDMAHKINEIIDKVNGDSNE